MHDGGKVQKLVCDDGTPKGAELILKERGFNTDSLVLDDMKTILATLRMRKVQWIPFWTHVFIPSKIPL